MNLFFTDPVQIAAICHGKEHADQVGHITEPFVLFGE